MNELRTIGHSNHPLDHFIDLLKMHAITAVGDVRSSPYSRFSPQYNRESLHRALKESSIAYVFLGEELGPRSEDPSCYVDGKVRYALLAGTDLFRRGLERLKIGMAKFRIALMCAEKDPITCHRMILVCRALRRDGFVIRHILGDGAVEDLRDAELRLLRTLKMPQLRIFDTVEDLIQRAYDTQADRIAHVRSEEVLDEHEPEPREEDPEEEQCT